MKVSLKHYGAEVSTSVKRDDLNIREVRDELLIPLLTAAGFHPQTVNDLFFDEDVDPPKEEKKK